MYKDLVAHEETVGNYKIEIVYDEGPENPFEHWDCNPPLAVNSQYGLTEYSTQYGNVLTCPTLTRGQILANISDVLEICGMPSLLALGREALEYSDDIEDGINQYISEVVDGAYSNEKLEFLCTLYNITGQPALLKSVSGASQGDWAEVLAVATPEFQKACGNAEGYWDNPEKLKPSIQLFEDWAYGNVYGYVITNNRTGHEDSCWGFYGDYDEDGGVLEEARDIVTKYLATQQGEDHG